MFNIQGILLLFQKKVLKIVKVIPCRFASPVKNFNPQQSFQPHNFGAKNISSQNTLKNSLQLKRHFLLRV